MKQAFLGAALSALVLSGCAGTQKAADTGLAAARAQVNPTLSTTDATFMTTAARGGMAEVQLGQLAQRNGRSPAVKRFGQHMIDDHGRANQAMMELARQKQVSPPEGIGAEHQQVYDRLAALRGRDFDRAYAQAMVEDHQEDIRLFEAEASDGTDPEVKAFAAQQVPMLREHLREVQALARR